MIKREDSVFIIGYEGENAIVDGNAQSKYKKMNTMELFEAGMYRASFVSSLYGTEEEFNSFAQKFNEKAGTTYSTKDEFKRLFGIKGEEQVKKIVIM